MKKMQNEKGFTLVELMIVVAIIGILAAIAIPQFAAYRVRGFNASAQSDAKNLATSEAAFFADWQVFGISVANGAGGVFAPAAAAAGAGAAILGGDLIGDGIGLTVAAAARGNAVALGNTITAGASVDATAASFTLAAKHLQGDTIFAVDGDSTATWQCPAGAACAVAAGTAMTMAAVPASLINTIEYTAAGGWVVK